MKPRIMATNVLNILRQCIHPKIQTSLPTRKVDTLTTSFLFFSIVTVISLNLYLPNQTISIIKKVIYQNQSTCTLDNSLVVINQTKIQPFVLTNAISEHYVKDGESISQLCQDYYVSRPVVIILNQIRNPNLIVTGQKIIIPPVDYQSPLLQRYQIKADDRINSLLCQYNLKLWQFKRLNPESDPDKLQTGMVVIMPVKTVSVHQQRLIRLGLERSGLAGMELFRPVQGVITSRYGWRWGRMHSGLDLAAATGTPIKAAAAGRIIFANWDGGYGQLVKINHGSYITYYGHLSKILVKQNQLVTQGEVIGLAGSTGHAYGSHLHFEVEKGGKKVNPLNYF